jgi:Ca-activated chloride channel family protein
MSILATLVRRALLPLAALLLPALAACDDAPGAGVTLRLLAGSEVRVLDPLLQEFAASRKATITVSHAGSLDIMNALRRGRDAETDAVWPANGVWISLGDSQRVVRDEASIMRTPIVFGVRRSLARELGWDRAGVSVADLLDAADKGRLRIGMTSATQSNSGAQFLLGALHAMAGRDTALSLDDLAREDVQDRTRRLLAAVQRGSGSSAWLGDFVVAHPGAVDAMVNYESVLIDVNRRLEQARAEPLCAVYPQDGLAVADHVLGFIDRPGAPGNDARRKLFADLRDWLLQPAQQRRIHLAGWRTARIGIEMPDADRGVFRAEWCIDPARTISPIRPPTSDVVEAALALYQGGGLRKPSETVLLYDVSGSMAGEGVRQARAAFRAILDQHEARRSMLQAGPRDVLHVVPFNHAVVVATLPAPNGMTTPSQPGTGEPWQGDVRGNGAEAYATLMARVTSLEADGGTDIYGAIQRAWTLLTMARAEGRLPAIVLMTDGRSDMAHASAVLGRLGNPEAEGIPIFAITFGNADPTQLEELARRTGGRVFDGRRDLVRAFRDAKGYN